MENGPFMDDFPTKTSIYKGFSMAMSNNQRVISPKSSCFFKRMFPSKKKKKTSSWEPSTAAKAATSLQPSSEGRTSQVSTRSRLRGGERRVHAACEGPVFASENAKMVKT